MEEKRGPGRGPALRLSQSSARRLPEKEQPLHVAGLMSPDLLTNLQSLAQISK